jgi:hypothetical protein
MAVNDNRHSEKTAELIDEGRGSDWLGFAQELKEGGTRLARVSERDVAAERARGLSDNLAPHVGELVIVRQANLVETAFSLLDDRQLTGLPVGEHERFIDAINHAYPELPDVRGAREDIRRSIREEIQDRPAAEKTEPDYSLPKYHVEQMSERVAENMREAHRRDDPENPEFWIEYTRETAAVDGNKELAAALKHAREHFEHESPILWWERIENAIERGAQNNAAQERQARGERPEGLERIESAAELEQMRGLRLDLVTMRQEIRRELQDETHSYEHRAALREVANELRDLHYETSREITALALEQRHEPGVIEAGRSGLKGFAHSIEGAGREAADIMGGFADMAGKLVDGLVDFFMTPSLPTPELIAARREARDDKAAEAEVNWQRYKADDGYRNQIDEQDRIARQEAERKYHQRDRHERGLDGREAWERER